MRKILFSFAFIAGYYSGFCQTFQTSGSWNTASNWSPSAVPSGATADVTVSANPTISSTNIIGGVTDGNSVTFTITSTGSLTIGASGTTKNMLFSNNGTITIASGGLLEIWGDLIVSNNLTLNVTGTLKVHGNISMNNGAVINISGSGIATVGGNLTGSTNTSLNVTLGGNLTVTGSLTLGSGSSIVNVAGTINAGGCSCGCLISGCSGNVVLPITLLFFKASYVDQQVHLTWATSSEINFDYFIIEKSANGIHFYDEAHIQGSGTSNSHKDYEYEDALPFTGLSYYRITTVDFDRYRETFNENVVSANAGEEKKIQVFPNPVLDGKMSVKINFDISSEGEITIYNCMGILIAKYVATSPETTIVLPIRDSGTYFAKFSSSQFSSVTRFTVFNN